MVELQIVILAVAGSSPVGHPASKIARFHTVGGWGWDVGISAPRAVACLLLKTTYMNPITDLFGQSQFRATPPNFWERIVNDDHLSGCNDLEKLLAGCEIIVALDGVDLLAA